MWDTLLESLETSAYTAKAEARAACARDYDMLRTKGNEVADLERHGRVGPRPDRAFTLESATGSAAEGTQKVVRIPAPSASRVAPMVLGGELID